MTPQELENIHRAAFAASRGWSAEEFQDLLSGSGCFLIHEAQGFAIGRVVADEAELLTIATHPEAQGQGIGRRCLQGFHKTAADLGAVSAFLEVAADNAPALHLYEALGWAHRGRRKNYYLRKDGSRVDALVLTRPLDQSTGETPES